MSDLSSHYTEEFWRQYPWELDDAPGTVRWFGDPWPSAAKPAAVCRPDTHITLPDGAMCTACGKPLQDGSRGVSIPGSDRWHYYGLGCWFAAILPFNVVAWADWMVDDGHSESR